MSLLNNLAKSLLSLQTKLIPPLAAPDPVSASSDRLTNQKLLDELLACFQTSIQEKSLKRRVLFDMYYLVVIHPDVYNDLFPFFPVITEDLLDEMYTIIRERPEERKGGVAGYWQFSYQPSTSLGDDLIDPTQIRVVGMPTGALQSTSGTIRATFKPRNSNVYKTLDINLELLSGLEFVATGIFRDKFNPDLIRKTESIKSVVGESLAKIEYAPTAGQLATWYMKDDEITIKRREPSDEYSSFLLGLDSEFVADRHVRIKFNREEDKYEILSLVKSPVMVNEQQIPPGSSGSNPVWSLLPNTATILLSGRIELRFQRLN